jgi:hypothetical protein
LAAQAAVPTPHVVLVQPIVVRGDDGQQPARIRIRETLIDRVYGRGGIDFHFFDPIWFDDAAARDGKKSLDAIVRDARHAGILRGGGEVIQMFFVNAVDGRPGPLGRGRQGGWVTFVALADDAPEAMEAFVVAHEAGHNLGLIHAVDDPHVPDDEPNLMGDGPFDQRVGRGGLTDGQFETLRASPLVHPRIECLAVSTASAAILDESYEPYFSRLQRREIAALTGATVEAGSLDECRQVARQRFQEAVLPFSPREAEAIRRLAENVTVHLAADFPLFAKHPWRFLKVENRLCGGFPHTRGLCIIFSQRVVDRVVSLSGQDANNRALQAMGPLFVHEQLHVLQRFYPDRFATLYQQQLGFVRGHVKDHDWLIERQILNPDALRLEWVFPTGEAHGETSHYWMRTILGGDRSVPRMGHDFQDVAVRVEPDREGYHVQVNDAGTPVLRNVHRFREYLARLPVRRGLDHPNEITAYTFQQIVLEEYFPPDADRPAPDDARRKHFDPIRKWAQQHLR